MVDRFATAEALNVLAHDYGLYAVKDRLDAIGFRASPMRETYESLSDDGLEVYDSVSGKAARWNDPYSVPLWAEDLLRQIERGE